MLNIVAAPVDHGTSSAFTDIYHDNRPSQEAIGTTAPPNGQLFAACQDTDADRRVIGIAVAEVATFGHEHHGIVAVLEPADDIRLEAACPGHSIKEVQTTITATLLRSAMDWLRGQGCSTVYLPTLRPGPDHQELRPYNLNPGATAVKL